MVLIEFSVKFRNYRDLWIQFIINYKHTSIKIVKCFYISCAHTTFAY